MKQPASYFFATLLGAALLSACATQGPPIAANDTALLNPVKAAFELQDPDLFLKQVSKEFSDPDFGGKENLRPLLLDAVKSGFFNDAQLIVDQATPTPLNETQRAFYPVILMTAKGVYRLEFIYTQEGNTWRLLHIRADDA